MVSWSAVLKGHCWREVSCVRVGGEVVLIYVKGLFILFVVDGTKGDWWMNLLKARNMGR